MKTLRPSRAGAVLACSLLFTLLIACSSSSPTATLAPTTTSKPTSTVAPTATSRPTDTPAPTATREPTDTPGPTDTPIPTDTPEPTEPPLPTDTAEPTHTPAAQPLYLGDVYEQDGYLLSALAVADPATPGLLYSPEPGTKLIAVEIIVGNASDDVIGVNPLDTTLVDGEGFVHKVELGGVDEQIITIDLSPGEKVKGWVGFEIPEGAAAAILKFAVDFLGENSIQADLTSPPAGHESNADALSIMPTDPEAKLGETFEDYGYSLSVTTVEDPTTPGMFSSPKEGNKLVAVEIVVGNVSGEPLSVNPLYATLVDSDGFVYSAELGGREGQIDAVDLNAGEKAKGWVAFEMPEDARPWIVKYAVTLFPSEFLQVGLTE